MNSLNKNEKNICIGKCGSGMSSSIMAMIIAAAKRPLDEKESIASRGKELGELNLNFSDSRANYPKSYKNLAKKLYK